MKSVVGVSSPMSTRNREHPAYMLHTYHTVGDIGSRQMWVNTMCSLPEDLNNKRELRCVGQTLNNDLPPRTLHY